MSAKPSEFVTGYEAGLRRFQVADEAGEEPDMDNPYDPNTHEWQGFEEAVYDLTQK